MLHAALADALPRTEPEDERLFKLLKRAYIEARYSVRRPKPAGESR